MRILLVISDVGCQVKDGLPVNNTVEELLGVYLALEKQGHEPWLLVNPGIDSTPYRSIPRTDDYSVLDRFDEVLINREEPNFFGGFMSNYTRWTINALCRFEGRIAHFFTDPEMAHGRGYLQKAWRKIYSGEVSPVLTGTADDSRPFTREELEDLVPMKLLENNVVRTAYENVHVRTAYPLTDHPIHYRFVDSRSVEFVDSWREHLLHVRPKFKASRLLDKDHHELIQSPCYIGTNKASRHNRLLELDLFSKEAEARGDVTFYGNIATFKNTRAKNRLNLPDVVATYENHLAALVIGNKKQNDTGINHRYLQGFILPRAVMVDATCDSKGLLVGSSELRDLTYFNTREEYLDRLAGLRDPVTFNRVVELLQAEKEMHMGMDATQFQDWVIRRNAA